MHPRERVREQMLACEMRGQPLPIELETKARNLGILPIHTTPRSTKVCQKSTKKSRS